MKVNKTGPPGRFRYEWDDIVAAAKENPGEWVTPEKEFPHTVYGALTRGRNSHFPIGQFQFATSNNHYNIEGKRLCTLHVRYLPTEESN